ELAAKGGNLALFTGFDILRDPRWGRSEECFSEDAYLTSCMTSAAVHGFQKEKNGVAVVVKHLCAQGGCVGGHNSDAALIGPRELREIHLPPVKAAIDAGAKAVMAAYNEIDGIPCHINKALLFETLRKEYDFSGIVMADGCALDRLLLLDDDILKVGSLALKAGVDLSLWDNVYLRLDEAIKQGYLTEEELDQAVLRVLRLKEELGLWEELNTYSLPEASDLLLQAARECQVLLKNNDSLLPLSSKQKIAVIGPNANHYLNQLGDYTAYQNKSDIVTVYDGICQKTEISPIYVQGCSIRGRKFDIEPALVAAKAADIVILVLGGNSTRLYQDTFENNGAVKANQENQMNCGENIDLASLELEGYQNELLLALKEVNPHIVTVLIQGRPHVINTVLKHSQAVLASFYPGSRGGEGIADVLFGDYNPSGHLSVSIPQHVGQLPCYYNHKHNGAQKDYVDMPGEALLPFGYGLSYSQFIYRDVKVPKAIKITDLLENGIDLQLEIYNNSTYDGEDVIQVYLKDHQASVVSRVIELKAFNKVKIQAYQSKQISIHLTSDAFAIWNYEMKYLVEPGDVSICIGVDSKHYQEFKLTLVK
ncbi:MAG: beta-glucosidase, partial [Erysipelatoclostridium ramosum]|nr:beta-glucosidase [Thomasclavelia ramosa]